MSRLAAIGEEGRREYVAAALRRELAKAGGNIREAAKELGVHYDLMWTYARNCGLDLSAEVRRIRGIAEVEKEPGDGEPVP